VILIAVGLAIWLFISYGKDLVKVDWYSQTDEE